MASEWYVLRDGGPVGPLPSRRLREMARAGRLLPDDLVCKAGAEWTEAGSVKGLFPAEPPSEEPGPDEARPEPPPSGAADTEDDASLAWKERESPFAGAGGLLGGLFGVGRSVREAAFSHRQRVLRRTEGGGEVLLDDVLDRLEDAYSGRGFRVRRHALAVLVVVKRDAGGGGAAPDNVGTLTNGFVRITGRPDGWVVSLKAEIFFWPRVMQQLLGAAGFACVALVLFWPCLCLVPFAFAVDAERARAALQDDVRAPLDRLAVEFV